ncbi:MAG: glycosyltransferase [Methylomarinum sp.]|nr:glycosyltransferase [Methylomarinum sp.]
MNKPYNILYISSRGDSGAGGENYLLTLFKNLDRNNFRPIVVLPKDGTLRKPLEDLGIEVIIIEANYSWLKPDIAWYNVTEGIQDRVKKLELIINEKEIDLVHTNSNLRFEGALAARLAGSPHLYLAHIEYQPDMPIFQRLPFSQSSFAQLMGELSDHTVAVSQSVANTLSSHITDNKLTVIHNGLVLDIFNTALKNKSNCLKQELGLTDDSILITAVGRITPDKGFDFFLESANLVLQNNKDKVHFIIAGDEENTDFTDALKLKTIDYSITNNFHFLGFRTDIPDILAESDIFVLSSRKEGHPYVMLEAMASECAVVASNCAGVEETIEEGISGFIVPIGNIDLLADRLQSLINYKESRLALAEAARKRIEDNFTADKSTRSLMLVYEKLLSLPTNKPGSFGVELFLQNCTEVAHLGLKNIEMNDRLKKVEQLANLLLDNFMIKALRSLKKFLLRR